MSKADSWIDYTILEDCMREVLNESAHRRVAVLDPVKLIINNFPDDQEEDCFAPNHPKNKDLGMRTINLQKNYGLIERILWRSQSLNTLDCHPVHKSD